MSCIREATRNDNDGLLSLTASTPMDGTISIRTDRYPDFFRLLDRRGPSRVLVAEEGGEIVGCVSAARVPVHVDGGLDAVHYLGDLKVHPGHRGEGVAASLLKAMHHELRDAGADLVLSTAAYGNGKVMPFFDGLGGLPRAVPAGVFRVYQILPSRRSRVAGPYAIREEPETPEISAFYNEHFRRYQFGPLFGPGTLRDARTWTARSNGDIKASLSLVDYGDARQNVIIRLPFVLGSLVSFLQSVRRFVPVPDVPAKNTPIRMLYIKALALRHGHEAALAGLIEEARCLAFESRHHFLAVGLHESDPMLLRLARLPKFTFKSMLFIVGLKRGNDEITRLTRRVPYEDYSLV